MSEISLESLGITKPKIIRNACPARLYKEAVLLDQGASISDT